MKKQILRGCAALALTFSTLSSAQAACTYEERDGYAHVVSVPSYAVLSISVKYQNVRLNPAVFPEPPAPGQVYQVQIKEPKEETCKQVHFEILKRVK